MFEEEMKKIHITINTAQRILAKHAAEVLTRESPVWSGEYVKSHKIYVGGNPPSFSRNAIPLVGKLPPKVSDAQALQMKATKRAELIAEVNMRTDFMSPIEPLHFANSAPHAALVEYVGWASVGAHHVYAKARESVKLKRKQLLAGLNK